jgi:phosphoglycerate dehydrogenase-like enzyme
MRPFLLLFAFAALLAAQQKKILVAGGPDMARELQTATTGARLVAVDKSNVMTEIVDADGFIGEITPDEVRAAKKLRWVGVFSAGVEHVLWVPGAEILRDSDIIVTNNKIVQGPEIADHALAMLLMNTRRLYHYYDLKQRATWDTGAFEGVELRGKTAVVIGVGGIGMQIALRANAFGMNVIGVDPEDKPFLPFLQRVVKPDQLDEVVPLADVVFISAPLTPKSRKMMGSKEFEMMKKGSYFIAVSRGGIYEMGGLVKALDEKRLAGAGVDVTDPEPLPKDHPLWKFDNVIITPHIAGRSDHDRERMMSTVRENVRRFAAGEPLLNVVDKQKGY